MLDLARAKAHLKIEAEDIEEDELVGAYLAAAVSHIESVTGVLLAPQTVTQRVASARVCGAIELYRSPVTEVISIDYVDGSGSDAVLADYRLVGGNAAVVLPALGSAWPGVAAAHPAALTVTYTAGFDPEEVPPALEQAALFLMGHFYNNREAVVTGTIATALPMAVDALIGPYRPIGIA